MKAVVTGGNVRFSVYITVVDSIVSDIDQALKAESQLADFQRDKGIPIVGYDEEDQSFHFIRSTGNRLQVELAGDIDATMTAINKRIYNVKSSAIVGIEYLIADYTVATGKAFTWLTGKGTADCPCDFRIEIDGATWLSEKISYDNRTTILGLQNPVRLSEGQNLKVYGRNQSLTGSDAFIETFIYGSEDNVV
jgi:hypothetical protein